MPYLLGYAESLDYQGGPLVWDIKAASSDVSVAADDPTALRVPDGWWAITVTSTPPGAPLPLAVESQFVRVLTGGGVVPIYGGVLRVEPHAQDQALIGQYLGYAVAARWVADLEDDTRALCAD